LPELVSRKREHDLLVRQPEKKKGEPPAARVRKKERAKRKVYLGAERKEREKAATAAGPQ